MREHEGLLTKEELNQIEVLAKTKNTDGYLKHYNRLMASQRKRITSILQDFFNSKYYYNNSL